MIRPLVPLQENDTYFQQLGQSINNLNLVGSNGIAVSQTHNGTVIKNTANNNSTNNLHWRGTFSTSASYAVNDVVFVDPNINYKTVAYDGSSSVSIPWEATASYNRPPIVAGLWVCRNAIQPYQFNEAYVTGSLLPGYLAAGIQLRPDGYRFYRYNVYYPIYPLIPTSSTRWISGSGFYTVTNQNYWTPLVPMVPARFCYNNVETTMFLAGMISGSSFDMTKLPFTGSYP